MEFAHSPQKSAAYAAQALTLMVERGIPPHPNNFTIWYSYCSGEPPELRDAIDILAEGDHQLDEDRSAQLYAKFCVSALDAVPVHLIAQRMESELRAVLAVVEQAGQHATAYGTTLERVEALVGHVHRADDLKHVISGILQKTRAVAAQGRDVEEKLRAAAVEIGQLRQELNDARKEAMTDPLTGLGNRKLFDFMLSGAAMEAVESGESMSLVMVDVDHFKAFNDTYGHVVGDQVLRLLAAVLTDAIKGQDTAARYGGEEFTIILPGTKLKNAAKLAENIRQRVAAKSMVHRKTGEQLGRVTISAGVAQLRAGETMRKFVERADDALYLAKRTGRNKVCCEVEGGATKAGSGAYPAHGVEQGRSAAAG